MNKKKLQRFKKLAPTPKMMNMAAGDAPIIRPLPYSRKSYINIYKTYMYMRVQVIDEVMKISLFITEHIRFGSKEPLYDIYLDFANDDFITYDYAKKKWSNAMLVNLSFPNISSYTIFNENCYISRETKKSIKKHLNVDSCDLNAINKFQLRVRSKQLEKKHQRIVAPWDKDMEVIPALPKDWNKWVQRVGITNHYIFYKYSRKGAETGYCTRCGKMVPIKNATNGKTCNCSVCKQPVTYRSIGKLPQRFTSDTEAVYLMQKTVKGFVIREFQVRLEYAKNESKTPLYHFYEIRRCIFDNLDFYRTYYMGLFKQKETRWILGGNLSYYCRFEFGRVYGKTIKSISQLKRTGLPEMIKNMVKIDCEAYMSAYIKAPYIERIAKAGLYRLCEDFVENQFQYYSENKINENYINGELCKMLNIDKQLLKRLRSANGGTKFLKWLQYAKSRNKIIPNDVISWFIENGVDINDIKFISDRMSEIQICRYIKQQLKNVKKYGDNNAKFIITTWQDYLEMAKRMKLNVSQEINYKPRNLINKHNECVEVIGDADVAKEANEISIKYPDIDKICSELADKYSFSDKPYSVVTPARIEDILNDSNELSHCVARTPDRYFERIQNRESYILFLRKTDNLDKPFYTLEVEPNGTVRQTRTKFNTQGKDIKEIKNFLVKWQKVISKKLSDEDIALGERSNKIRIKEYGDLRTKKAKISAGTYQGKLLADVLEADLLINNRRCS